MGRSWVAYATPTEESVFGRASGPRLVNEHSVSHAIFKYWPVCAPGAKVSITASTSESEVG